MKHFFPITIFLFFLWAPLLGQLQLGLEGGAGLSAQTGLQAALPVEWRVSPLISIRSGLTFVQRGQSEILEKLTGDLDYRHAEMSYLSLPVLLKFHLRFKDVSAYTAFGPTGAYSLSLGVNYLQSGTIYRKNFSQRELNLSRIEIGAQWEVGLQREIRGRKKIYAAYRYHLGLSDVDQDPENEIFHQGGLLILGFLLPLGKERLEKR